MIIRIKTFAAFWIQLAMIIAFAGCASITSPVSGSTLSKEIRSAEEGWQAHKIVNYEIDVHYFTYGADIYTHLVVLNGQVADKKCEIGTMFKASGQSQCDWFNQHFEDFTIPGLFEAARTLDRNFQSSFSASDRSTAPHAYFNRTYSYPERLIWQLPEYSEWNVTSFKKLGDIR